MCISGFAAIQSCRVYARSSPRGGDFRRSTFPDIGHDAWRKAWREDAVWEWMFSKTLDARKKSRLHGASKPSKDSDGVFYHLLAKAKCSSSVPGKDSGHGPDRVVDGFDATAYVLGSPVAKGALVGGIECMILGVCAVSVLMFMQVACLRSIDRIGAVVVAMLVLVAAAFLRQIGRHVGRQSNCEALPGMSSGLYCGQMRWLAVSICIFIVYAVLALTHTFVAPTGLGTVGGKAKLLFLSIGFPRGFFADPSFMLYQPPYPPGGALAFATVAIDTPKVSVVKWHHENWLY